MKIVQYLGGLGNQMFQHAFYRALEKRYSSVKADLSQFQSYNLHNGYELGRVFGVNVKVASKWDVNMYYNPSNDYLTRKLRRIAGLKNSVFYERTEFGFDADIFNDAASRYFIGYWQNGRYFSSFADTLKEEFKFTAPLNNANTRILEAIRSANSVGIHIRRGDYINNRLHGGICDISYYMGAVERIKALASDPLFFVFSNDISWCKQNISGDDMVFVEHNTGYDAATDMRLMSECKHQIIANSSFSWWAAWLNSNKTKVVIGPKKWINGRPEQSVGILPPNWIKL